MGSLTSEFLMFWGFLVVLNTFRKSMMAAFALGMASFSIVFEPGVPFWVHAAALILVVWAVLSVFTTNKFV